jgi:hypothetical protein
MRYKEKQLYKKFQKIALIFPRGWLDKSYKNDIKFYARFLVIYVLKCRKIIISVDIEYNLYKKRKEERIEKAVNRLQMKQKHNNLNFRSEYGEDMNENSKRNENI